MKLYTDAIIEEIKSYKRDEKIKIDTIFFGGGTPSILAEELIERIYFEIQETFDILRDCEISIEINPGTVTFEKLELYKNLGINRISIGLQSIHENEMKILGRIHTYQEFLSAYRMVRDCGFDNVNVDLMYSIPEQTKESFEKTLDTITQLNPEHLSVYGLIIEEGTPFFELRNSLNLPSEDEEYDMYETAHNKLSSLGYHHYEISNYSREGKYSRHNLKYWQDEEYIGVGLSAHSYFEDKRFSNTSDFSEYFSSEREKYRQIQRIGKKDSFEYAMLALRLSRGLSLSEYKELFKKEFTDGKENLLELYMNNGYMEISDGFLRFTYKGFYVSNTILAELL